MLFARLTNIELVGNLETKGPSSVRPDHFIVVFIDEEEAVRSGKTRASTLRWQGHHQFGFHPASMIKISLFRQSTFLPMKRYLVGNYVGNAAQLLENHATLDLTDGVGSTIVAQFEISLSLISEPAGDFMRRVEADLERMENNVLTNVSQNIETGLLGSCITPLGQTLQLIVKIMDVLADAHPIVKVSWTVLSAVYKAMKQQMVQDEAIRGLAESLREMVGVANECPDLKLISGTTNVLEEVGRAALQVASLIDEYTRSSFMRRTVKFQITDDMKSHIDECQNRCRDIMQKFDRRVMMKTSENVIKLDSAVRDGFNTIQDKVLAEKICSWLSAPDSSRNYNEARAKHQGGTGSWVITGTQFSEWQASPDSFLWIYGMSGCGKTILCSTIIEAINEVCDRHPSRACAYFFFDGRDSQKALQLHENLIRSLILQFFDQCDGIPAALAEVYKKCNNGHQQPSLDSLQGTLLRILDGFIDAYVIIDSLDECMDRDDLLRWIENITLFKTERLHLLVTSRPEGDIKDSLQSLGVSRVSMEVDPVNRDIETYLAHKMWSDPKLSRWDEATRETMKDTLMREAQGMFRWAALQLDELRNCSTPHAVQQQLGSLPEGLDETYDRILSRINKHHRDDAKIILTWATFANRPLTLSEITEAIAFDFDPETGPRYNSSHKYPVQKDILIACSGLIINSEESVKLAHFSVKEYLVSEHIWNGVSSFFGTSEILSHSLIAQTCLAYLLRFDKLDSITESTIDSFPLANYAANFWVFHTRFGDNDSSHVLQKQILDLLQFQSPQLTNWLRIHDPDQPWSNVKPEILPTDIAAPLYYASLVGLLRTSRQLLDNGAEVDSGWGRLGGALQAASYGGHKEIVQLLIGNGADVNAHGGEYGSALQAASYQGHEGIVKLLLQNQANADTIEGGVFGNALQAATEEGHEGIVKLLLRKGANVNAEGGLFGSALQGAASVGHEGLVKFLLANGSNVKAEGGFYGNALQAASYEGHGEIVKLLLENGANANAEGGPCRSALQAASEQGHEDIEKLLLKYGANDKMS